MTVFLWTHFVLGCVAVLGNAYMAGTRRTITTSTADFVWRLVINAAFLVWVGVLLFGGDQ